MLSRNLYSEAPGECTLNCTKRYIHCTHTVSRRPKALQDLRSFTSRVGELCHLFFAYGHNISLNIQQIQLCSGNKQNICLKKSLIRFYFTHPHDIWLSIPPSQLCPAHRHSISPNRFLFSYAIIWNITCIFLCVIAFKNDEECGFQRWSGCLPEYFYTCPNFHDKKPKRKLRYSVDFQVTALLFIPSLTQFFQLLCLPPRGSLELRSKQDVIRKSYPTGEASFQVLRTYWKVKHLTWVRKISIFSGFRVENFRVERWMHINLYNFFDENRKGQFFCHVTQGHAIHDGIKFVSDCSSSRAKRI